MPEVFIIVPVHNRVEYTLKFLDSIKDIDYKDYQIVLIDDGSTDNTYETVRNLYPEVSILQGDGNFWWTKAVNLGVKYALANGADYILTLNNDLIVDKNIINALVECAKNNPNNIIGSKIHYESSKISHGGGKRNLLFPPNFNITPFGKLDNYEYEKIREVDSIAGIGMLIPVNIFKEIGFFDERNFPHYYADTEFTLRAKKAGFKLLFCPGSIIFDNPETTWKFPNKLSPDIFKHLLFDTGSGYLLKANFRLYYHYWPKAIWFIPFCILYLKCFVGVLLILYKKINRLALK